MPKTTCAWYDKLLALPISSGLEAQEAKLQRGQYLTTRGTHRKTMERRRGRVFASFSHKYLSSLRNAKGQDRQDSKAHLECYLPQMITSQALGWAWQGEKEDERVWGALKSHATSTANALPNCHHGKKNKTTGLTEKQRDNHSPKKSKSPQNKNQNPNPAMIKSCISLTKF